MLFNIETTEPTSGQFVAIWEHGGKLWSRVFKRRKGVLLWYKPDTDTWEAPAPFNIYKPVAFSFSPRTEFLSICPEALQDSPFREDKDLNLEEYL